MHESVKLLEQRCLATPGYVREVPIETLESVEFLLRQAALVLVTGIGASEGPARLLASCLTRNEHQARFIPYSGLIAGDHSDWIAKGRPTVLVVFSQALSPNARMALRAGVDFSATLLICGLNATVNDSIRGLFSADQLHVIRHPPDEETGFLLRVAGPAVASAVALGLAALATTERKGADIRDKLAACADAMEMRIHTRPLDVNLLERPPAFLVYGADGVERNHLLRWTLLECLEQYDPSTWDLLAFAHGAFQNIYDASRTLIVPRALNDDALVPFVERLRVMLSQTRHRLIELPSALPRPWCLLEHLAAVQSLMLEHLRQHPRDLCAWPGQRHDGPLYTVDRLPAGA